MVFDPKKIKAYMLRQLKIGYSPEAIKYVLLKVGVPEELISQVFKELNIIEKKKPFVLTRLLRKIKRKTRREVRELVESFEREVRKGKRIKKIRQERRKKWFERLRRRTKRKAKEKVDDLGKIQKKVTKPIKEKKEEVVKDVKGDLKTIKKKFLTKKIVLGTFITIFIVLVLLFLYFWILVPTTCSTNECFMKSANKCGWAKYIGNVEGTTFEFETKDCILTKTIVGMKDDEPPEVVDRFLGKSMECTYVENRFSPLYTSTIAGLLDNCEGELSKAIYNFLV